MNVPFVVAGVLAIAGAAVHGILGEKIVVSRLRREALPSSKFGSSSFTLVMIRATWHITTLAFVVLGSALLACTPDATGGACEAVGRVTAIAYASFFALSIGLVAPMIRRIRLRHPAPLLFALVAVLSWWGAGR
jgi:hypothetical protein